MIVVFFSIGSCLHPSFTSAPPNDQTVTSIKPSSTDFRPSNTEAVYDYAPTPQLVPQLDNDRNADTNVKTTSIITGVVLGGLLLIAIITVTLIVIFVVIFRKKPKSNTYLDRNASMIGNAAYIGTTFENVDARYSEFCTYNSLRNNVAYNARIFENSDTEYGEVLTYDYPRFNAELSRSFEKEKTRAHNTTFAARTRPSTTYVTLNIRAQRNEAYAEPSTNSFEYSYVKYD